jgi:hypothetical protein
VKLFNTATPTEPAAEVEDELALAVAALADAEAVLAAARASRLDYRVGPAADLREAAAQRLAELREPLRRAQLERLRAELAGLEEIDQADLESAEAALARHVAPILARMRARFDQRQALSMTLMLGVRCRHMEIFAPDARERWGGFNE